MNIRRIQVNDLAGVLACNLHNLPENYPMQFWAYIILTWPDLSFLAEDEGGKVVGYVLSSIEHAEGDPHTQVGCINSLSVLRPYRRLGLAQKLMDITRDAMMREDITLSYLQLHVRKSNRAAQALYNKLGYRYHGVEEKYYADDEDARIMRFQIKSKIPPQWEERPSSDPQRRARNICLANLWHCLHVKLSRLVGATMRVFRWNK